MSFFDSSVIGSTSDKTTSQSEVKSGVSRTQKILTTLLVLLIVSLYAPMLPLGVMVTYFLWRWGIGGKRQKQSTLWMVVAVLLVVSVVWHFILRPDYLLPFTIYKDWIIGGASFPEGLTGLLLPALPIHLTLGAMIGAIVARSAFNKLPEEQKQELESKYGLTPIESIQRQLRVKKIAQRAPEVRGRKVVGVDVFNGEAVEIPDNGASPHGLILGATGSGKTVTGTQIIQSFIESASPTFIMDLKGSNKFAAEIKKSALINGRKFMHLSMQNGYGAEISPLGDPHYHLPPLQFSDYNSKENRVQALFPVHEGDGGYYDKLRNNYLKICLQAMTLNNFPNLGDHIQKLRELSSTISNLESYLMPLEDEIEANPLDNSYRTRLIKDTLIRFEDLKQNAKSKEAAKGATQEVINILSGLQNSSIGHLLTPSPHPELNIDIEQFSTSSDVILISMDGLQERETSSVLANVFILLLEALSGKLVNKHEKQSVKIFIDEFNVMKGDYIANGLNKFREAGFEVWLATTGISDIAATGGAGPEGQNLVDRVFTNSGTVIAHRIEAHSDRTYLSDYSGQHTINRMTKEGRFNESMIGTTQYSLTGKSRTTEEKENILTPANFGELAVGQCYIFTTKTHTGAKNLAGNNENIHRAIYKTKIIPCATTNTNEQPQQPQTTLQQQYYKPQTYPQSETIPALNYNPTPTTFPQTDNISREDSLPDFNNLEIEQDDGFGTGIYSDEW